MTNPCETSGDQADVGDGVPCLGTGDGFLPVFGQLATSPEPRLKPEPKGRFTRRLHSREGGKASPLTASTNVRLGSKADIQCHTHLRPLSGAKQTSNVRFLSLKRSCADDVRFRG